MSVTPKADQLLQSYTTLQIGGVADYLVEVTTEDELLSALDFARKETDTKPLILGGGSNVLCHDDGYRGLVIINKIAGYESYTDESTNVLLSVGAGENLDQIIERTITDGFWGLENLSAIPGSVGATPIQNVGAYGVEISEYIESVEAINLKTDEKKTFSKEDCQFGYRDSFFKSREGKVWCVTGVTYRLSTTPTPVLTYKDLAPLVSVMNITQMKIREHVIDVRSKKFPDWHSVGTAGSFFKNPIITTDSYNELIAQYPDLPGYTVDDQKTKVSLGWILDKVCNLRGYRSGAVRLYEQQALVLVVDGAATAKEVENFVLFVANKVKEHTGIAIEREVLSV